MSCHPSYVLLFQQASQRDTTTTPQQHHELTEQIMNQIMTTTPHPRSRSFKKNPQRHVHDRKTTTKKREISGTKQALTSTSTWKHTCTHDHKTAPAPTCSCTPQTQESDEKTQKKDGRAPQSTDTHTHAHTSDTIQILQQIAIIIVEQRH